MGFWSQNHFTPIPRPVECAGRPLVASQIAEALAQGCRPGGAVVKQKELEQDDIKLRIELAKLKRSSGPRYVTADEKRELAPAPLRSTACKARRSCV